MSKLRVNCFSVSLDGYGAGPDQGEQHPLGKGGEDLHQWLYPTRTFQSMLGSPEKGTSGSDDDFARRGMENLGAWILGRNMFGPVRGPWPDETWRGWWGNDPPYHVPVFVLTHHARKPLEMEGGTVFHFVTSGFEDAVRQARQVAGARDVRLGGGANVIRQGLRARLIDELHLAVAPVILGSGEPLLEGIDLKAAGYRVTQHIPGAAATHVVLERT
jgi:dihydrofolate reductase